MLSPHDRSLVGGIVSDFYVGCQAVTIIVRSDTEADAEAFVADALSGNERFKGIAMTEPAGEATAFVPRRIMDRLFPTIQKLKWAAGYLDEATETLTRL